LGLPRRRIKRAGTVRKIAGRFLRDRTPRKKCQHRHGNTDDDERSMPRIHVSILSHRELLFVVT
jgi:hypothetical protein